MQAVIPYSIGFNNLSNTCYANSILSCLMQTRDFNTYFGAQSINNIPRNNFTVFIKAINELINASYKNNSFLSRNFNKILIETLHERKMFTFKLQHDAQEFLIQIITSLERELNCLLRNPNISNQAIQKDITNCYNFIKHLHPKFKRVLSCIICSHQKEIANLNDWFVFNIVDSTITPMQHLQTIPACISSYFKKQIFKCCCPNKIHSLKNNFCNAYKCEKCQTYIYSSVTTTITFLPDILIITLNIFDHKNVSFQPRLVV